MIYKKREDLLIVDTNEVLEIIYINDIKEKIIKPNYYIYFENKNEIYGFISIKDIKEAIESNNEFVNISNNIEEISTSNYMSAKYKFLENVSINEIPVVKDNKLVGCYIKGTNYSALKSLYEFFDMIKDINSKKICLVRSSNYYSDEKIEFFKNYFESKKAVFTLTSFDKFPNMKDNFDYVLFETEAECDNYVIISKIIGKGFSFTRYQSLYSFYDLCNDSKNNRTASKFLTEFFHNLENQGVNVYNVYMSYDHDTAVLLRAIKNKYKVAKLDMNENIIPNEEEFFGELYSKEYADEIKNTRLPMKSIAGVNYLSDYSSNYFNVSNGIRLTTDNIDNPNSFIHMFGPCITIGTHVEDKYTIESFVQRRLNDNEIKINVVNHGALNNTLSQMEMINQTDIYSGDTVVFFSVYNKVPEIKNIDIMDIIKGHNIPLEWYVDGVVHVNHIINEMYADAIFEEILPCLNEESNERNLVSKDLDITSKVYLQKYFSNIDLSKYNKIGAVIINCNPFTLGHQYLVEESSKRVDFLIVFVVDEASELFDFQERFSMVREGTKHLNNVYVVPNWTVLASRKSFPEYFTRSTGDELDYHLRYHVDAFADYIASSLGIKYRFVGTEKNDFVTGKLNEAMKEYFPKKGIELVELERKEYNNKPISASTVRKLIEEEKISELKNYLPETTIKIIFEDEKNC